MMQIMRAMMSALRITIFHCHMEVLRIDLLFVSHFPLTIPLFTALVVCLRSIIVKMTQYNLVDIVNHSSICGSP